MRRTTGKKDKQTYDYATGESDGEQNLKNFLHFVAAVIVKHDFVSSSLVLVNLVFTVLLGNHGVPEP